MDTPRSALEAGYERDQLRPTTELPPLPPLAGHGGESLGEVVGGRIVGLAELIAGRHPAPVIGELSGVYCQCGLEMVRVRELSDGRTAYRCQCGKGVTF